MSTVDGDVSLAAVRVEQPAPGVLWVVLNRPSRLNAIDRRLGDELFGALEQGLKDPATRVVVLSGAGRAFCAGDDLRAVAEHLRGDYRRSPVIGATLDPMYLRIIELLVTSRVPVITAINGAAVGAGAELACAGDLRIASATARLGSGLIHVAQAGGLAMLARIVGAARATEIYLSGDLVDAIEGRRLGIFTEVVAPDQFDTRVLAEARRLAAAPTAAIGLFKELRERCVGQPLQLALRVQNEVHLRNNAEVADAHEGATAFVQGRPPRFVGR